MPGAPAARFGPSSCWHVGRHASSLLPSPIRRHASSGRCLSAGASTDPPSRRRREEELAAQGRFRKAKAKESMDRQSDRHPEIARAKGCAFSAKVKWELREADTHLGQRPCGRATRPDTNPLPTGQFRLKSALDPWGASTQTPLAQVVRQPPRRDQGPAAPGTLGT
jgi:hypothetical protein